MKKSILVFVGIILLISIMSTQVLAAASYGEVKKVSEGDIKLDAFNDEPAWSNALEVPINRLSPSSPNTERAMINGVGYFLWSDKGMYVYFEVDDPTPTHIASADKEAPGAANWNIDCFELFFNAANTGDNSGIVHFSVDIDGWGKVHISGVDSFGSDKDAYYSYVHRTEGTKYIGEMLVHIPGVSLKSNDKIAILLQIDDMSVSSMDDGGDRVVILSANSDNADSWDGDRHDYIVLSDTAAFVPAPVEEQEAQPAVQDVPQNNNTASPKTGDNTIILTALLTLTMSFAAITFNRKKPQNKY